MDFLNLDKLIIHLFQISHSSQKVYSHGSLFVINFKFPEAALNIKKDLEVI